MARLRIVMFVQFVISVFGFHHLLADPKNDVPVAKESAIRKAPLTEDDEFLPQKEHLDDAGEALQLARRKLESVVKDASTRLAAARIIQRDGGWWCLFVPRLLVNKDRKMERFAPGDYVVEIKIPSGEATVTRK